jgi:hypothetical protein
MIMTIKGIGSKWADDFYNRKYWKIIRVERGDADEAEARFRAGEGFTETTQHGIRMWKDVGFAASLRRKDGQPTPPY